MNIRQFKSNLDRSHLSEEEQHRLRCALEEFTGLKVEKLHRSHTADDKKGADMWALLSNGKRVGVDHKKRFLNPGETNIRKFWNSANAGKEAPFGEELTIELLTRSSNGAQVLGGTLRKDKITSFQWHLFDTQITPSAYLLDHRCLLMACASMLPEWAKAHYTAWSPSPTWDTACCYVPAREVIPAHNAQLEKLNSDPDAFNEEWSEVTDQILYQTFRAHLAPARRFART